MYYHIVPLNHQRISYRIHLSPLILSDYKRTACKYLQHFLQMHFYTSIQRITILYDTIKTASKWTNKEIQRIGNMNKVIGRRYGLQLDGLQKALLGKKGAELKII